MFPVNLWLFKDRMDATKTITIISEIIKTLAAHEFWEFLFLNNV
jgi:hypothetical protein